MAYSVDFLYHVHKFSRWRVQSERRKLALQVKLTSVILRSELSAAHDNSMLEICVDELSGTLPKSFNYIPFTFSNTCYILYFVYLRRFSCSLFLKNICISITRTPSRNLPFDLTLWLLKLCYLTVNFISMLEVYKYNCKNVWVSHGSGLTILALWCLFR